MLAFPFPGLATLLTLPCIPAVAVGLPLALDFAASAAWDAWGADAVDERAPFPPIPSILWAITTATGGWAAHLASMAGGTDGVRLFLGVRLILLTWRPLFSDGTHTSMGHYPRPALGIAVDMAFIASTHALMAYQMALADATTVVWNAPTLAWNAYALYRSVRVLLQKGQKD